MARNPLTPFRSGGLFGGGDPLLSLHREMNRLFDDLYRGGLPTAGAGTVADVLETRLNVSETENEFRITAELPGVDEEDIDVRLEDDVLSIRGEKKFERTEGDEKEDYHFVERSYGTFQRSLRLPMHVDPDQVQASFENGVLKVTLPKTQQQERTRRIQVQRAQGQAGKARQEITRKAGGKSGGTNEGKGGES